MQPENSSSSSGQLRWFPSGGEPSEKIDAISGTNGFKAIPARPKAPPPVEHLSLPGESGAHSALRPRRLVTPQGGEASNETRPQSKVSSSHPTNIAPSSEDSAYIALHHLPPGTFLRGERYCLQTVVSQQEWLSGAAETVWVTRDAQRAGASVVLCEVRLPDCGLMEAQAFLRRATIALTSIGRHPRIPMLWDVFTEQGRHFFVFEPVDGESLAAHVRRIKQPLSEGEAIVCAIQVAETLDFLSQQSSPLVHGGIRPEHIIANRLTSAYMLTNFSPLLAGAARQFLVGMPAIHLSPFLPADFVQNPFDARGDLYALVASIYYVLTGHMPAGNGEASVLAAHTFNSALSMECNAVLEKGLHPLVEQRYQTAAALLSDLRALHSVREGRYQHSGSLASVQRLRQSGRIPAVSSQMSPAMPPAREKAPAPPFQSPAQDQPPSVSSVRQTADIRGKLNLLRKELVTQLRELSFWQKDGRPHFLLVWGALVVLLLLLLAISNLLAGR